MPRPRVYKTEAIVLRQRKLGEADKIVTLFSPNKGKLDAVAKGVRRTRSRLAGHLEPLTHGSYLLAEGRDLDIVTQAETLDAHPGLRLDLERMSRGLYCAELVDRLLPERSEAWPVFRLLRESLARIEQAESADLAVRFFETRLLDELGYRPRLDVCAVCDRRLEPVTNYWSAAAGGVVGPECTQDLVQLQPLSLSGLKVLRLLARSSYADAARLRITGELALELEECLGGHIRYVLEREVRSARFVEALRRLRRQTESVQAVRDV
ncbi:MAG TPA: DNA repair protein RecO [Dehalococcoidia bacterium]|nr:DNA repair protein RecO [Dehalococcoidia bacterium]